MPEPTILIRPITLNDVAVLAAIYCVCFAEAPWFEVIALNDAINDMLEVLNRDNAVMVLAEIDGVPVGAAWLFNVEHKADVMELANIPPQSPYISEIFVSPAARGRGIARAMVETLLKSVPNAELGAVRTSVNQPVIIGLFESLGWTIVTTESVESTKCIDGAVTTAPDTRVILVGKIANT